MATKGRSEACLEARRQIIAAANEHRVSAGLRVQPYSMRHLQEAVSLARNLRLVPVSVLETAGFNAKVKRS